MKENTRTLAFQIPESLYLRVNAYKERNHMTLRSFVLGLIKDELDRDEEQMRKKQAEAVQDEEETQVEAISEGSEAPVSEDSPGGEYEYELEEAPDVGDSESGFDELGEEESEQESANNKPGYAEAPGGDFTELGDGEVPKENKQGEGTPGGGESYVSDDTLDDEYNEQEEIPDVGDSEGGLHNPGEDKSRQEIIEAPPDCGFIEGGLDPAFEFAPHPDFGEDVQPPFPEPESEEEPEYGGMGMLV